MKKYSISKGDIIAFIMCFSFIQVDALLFIIGRIGYVALMMVTSLFIIVVTVRSKTIIKSHQFVIWTILLLWMTLCTIINAQTLLYPIYYVGQVTIWYLINDWYIENGSLRLLRAFRKYMGFVIVITFIQQIIFPGIFGYTDSMNARNVLASDNFLGYNYVAYIAVCFILDYVYYRKIQAKSYFMMAVCFASLIRAWSVKSVIGIGGIVFYVLFVYRKKISKIFSTKVILITFAAIFVSVVF